MIMNMFYQGLGHIAPVYETVQLQCTVVTM